VTFIQIIHLVFFHDDARPTGEGEQSHVPTADRVSRVFSSRNDPPDLESSSEEEQDASEELEEIDFNDMEKLLDVPDLPSSKLNAEVSMVEEKFTGFYIDTNKAPVAANDAVSVDDADTAALVSQQSMVVDDEPAFNSDSLAASMEPRPQTPSSNEAPNIQGESPDSILPLPNDIDDAKTPIATVPTEIPGIPEDEEFTGFYIDTEPSKISVDLQPLAADVTMRNPQIEDDEEIIVYVAPHPRSGRITRAPTPELDALDSDLPSTSILTGITTTRSSFLLTSTPPALGYFTASVIPASGSTTSSVNAISASPSATHTSTPTTQTPTPSSRRLIPAAPSFSSISISPAPTPGPSSSSPGHRQRQRKYQPAVSTPRHRKKAQVKLRMQEARAARKRAQQEQVLFGSFGAIREEAQLRGDVGERDPRWEERRRDDSDVDWGDEDGGGEEGGIASVGKGKEKEKDEDQDGLAEGMDLDPELELDADAMRSFVRGMDSDGQKFVTMDDIADAEMMRKEDDDEDDDEEGGSSDEEDETDGEDEEIEAIVNAEEELLIAEAGSVEGLGGERADDESEDEDDSDDEDDEWQSPTSGFKARLERLRNRPREKRPRDASDEDDDDDDDLFEKNLSWAEEDEEFIAHIQVCVTLAHVKGLSF
jgi:hypothetical protein